VLARRSLYYRNRSRYYITR